jgi:DNA-binding CsgD family transcriptional regulator
MEQQRIVPAMVALFEYEWITGKGFVEQEAVDIARGMVENSGNIYENSEFNFWLSKARGQQVHLTDFFEGYKAVTPTMAARAAAIWKQLGCPYEEALFLFEGSEADKRKAIEIVDKLGAIAVFEKLKFLMRASGIKQVPRGIRKTTRSNTANLTQRELDILELLKEGLQNKEIANRLFISPKTVDHHISSILFKLDVNSRAKAVQEALHLEIIK